MDMLRCRTAFIPFLMAGDPDMATTSKAIQILDKLGADIIELGVPYSVSIAHANYCSTLMPCKHHGDSVMMAWQHSSECMLAVGPFG